jgi:hypothetical protein
VADAAVSKITNNDENLALFCDKMTDKSLASNNKSI